MNTQNILQKTAPSLPGRPILGHIPKMAKDPLGLIWDSAMNYGDVVGLSFVAVNKALKIPLLPAVKAE